MDLIVGIIKIKLEIVYVSLIILIKKVNYYLITQRIIGILYN